MIDLEANVLCSREFSELADAGLERRLLEFFASPEGSLEERTRDPSSAGRGGWALTFKKLLSETDFAATMRRILEVLSSAYDYPIEIEFTTNFSRGGGYRVNLLQCRPFQVRGGGPIAERPRLDREDLVFEASGAVVGRSRVETIDRVVYVVPSVYGRLPLERQYAVARLIGKLVRSGGARGSERLLLVGPGRWGTMTPSLGVPVSFGEISAASVLCEIVAMREGLVPDVSLGTHFFNELVEFDMLYVGLFPGREGNFVNEGLFERWGERVPGEWPGAEGLREGIWILERRRLPTGSALRLHADAVAQSAVLYVDRSGGLPEPSAS